MKHSEWTQGQWTTNVGDTEYAWCKTESTPVFAAASWQTWLNQTAWSQTHDLVDRSRTLFQPPCIFPYQMLGSFTMIQYTWSTIILGRTSYWTDLWASLSLEHSAHQYLLFSLNVSDAMISRRKRSLTDKVSSSSSKVRGMSMLVNVSDLGQIQWN